MSSMAGAASNSAPTKPHYQREVSHMGFVSFADLARPAHPGKRGSYSTSLKHTDSVLVGMSTSGRETDAHTDSITFRISESLCRKARLLPGDRAELAVDAAHNLMRITRLPGGSKGGLAVSRSGGKLADYEPGTFVSCQIKATWYEGMPRVSPSAECTELAVDGTMIIFKLPPNTQFAVNPQQTIKGV